MDLLAEWNSSACDSFGLPVQDSQADGVTIWPPAIQTPALGQLNRASKLLTPDESYIAIAPPLNLSGETIIPIG
jgi:hypothetical protein